MTPRAGVVEPTAAAAPAAISGLIANGSIAESDRVVVLLSGSGLKATDKIMEHVQLQAAQTAERSRLTEPTLQDSGI